jgi:hypothetical protein
MASSKRPRKTTAQGSISATRGLANAATGKANVEGGSELLPPREIEGPVAKAAGNIGMVTPTDVEYETLRIGTGGELPCSVADFKSGKAHRELYEILKREFREIAKQGKSGLEL